MTRSEFLRFVAGLGTLTLAAAACKKSDDGQDPVDAPASADAASPIDSPSGTIDGGIDAPAMACPAPKTTISGNHGHSFVVAPADVEAGVEKSYNIKGGSAHPHTVVVTAAMFADLKMNKVVTTNSSEDADHIHPVTVSCG